MLVIRRHPGESIRIGEEVEVLIIDCGQGRVKLGIRAPKEIQVMRSEVGLTREQNLSAARAIEMRHEFLAFGSVDPARKGNSGAPPSSFAPPHR